MDVTADRDKFTEWEQLFCTTSQYWEPGRVVSKVHWVRNQPSMESQHSISRIYNITVRHSFPNATHQKHNIVGYGLPSLLILYRQSNLSVPILNICRTVLPSNKNIESYLMGAYLNLIMWILTLHFMLYSWLPSLPSFYSCNYFVFWMTRYCCTGKRCICWFKRHLCSKIASTRQLLNKYWKPTGVSTSHVCGFATQIYL